MLVYVVLVLGLMILYIVGIQFSGEGIGKESRSEREVLQFLYPAVMFWLEKAKILKWDRTKNRLETLRMLYPGENAKERFLHEMCRRVAIIYTVMFAASLICLGVQASTNVKVLEDVTFIRPKPGEMEANKELTVILRDKEHEVSEDTVFHIQAREYEEKEVMQFEEEIRQKLCEVVKGENASLENVTKPLNLITKLPGNPYKISWNLSGQSLIDENGVVHNKEIKEKQVVTIQASLIYKKREEYLELPIGVEPYCWSWSEQALYEFYTYVEKLEENSSNKETYKMPSKIGEIQISYEEKVVEKAKKLLALGVLACVALYVYWEQDIIRRKKQYMMECQRCYPSLVSKFTLLIGAGMTVRGAWQRMVMDYCKEKEMNSGHYVYVYEEMLITWNEILNGITETEAFNRFGRRLKLRCYMRLCSLITQNLRKGTRGFLVQLEAEAREAQEERKQVARQLGEEAGTKMLFPMLIMLVIVLMIVMVPAFLSFSKGGL